MELNAFIPRLLLGAYVVLFALLSVAPYDRSVWFAENLPIAGIVLALVILYVRGVRFSPLAYALMSVLVFMHTVGGHYTFERVPFDWFNDVFGFERNMYDRVAHFTVGFYAYAFAEWLDRSSAANRRFITYLLPLFAIAFVAMSYEIIEWWYAAGSDPAAGSAFLGSQGDIWDAQKDMLADTLGAATALILYALVRFRRRS
jgi:putative membrane protein